MPSMNIKVPSKRHRGSSSTSSINNHGNRIFSSSGVDSPSRIQARPSKQHQRQRPKDVDLTAASNPSGLATTSSRASSVTSASRLDHIMPPYENVVGEDDTNIQEREESDSLDQVVMSLDLRDKGTVGCCYYVAREEILYLMEDVTYGGLEVINMLKLHISPTVILLSTRIDESVINHLYSGRSTSISIDDDDRYRLPYTVEARPSSEFNYESGKRKLIKLRLSTDEEAQLAFITPGDTNAYDDDADDAGAGYTRRRGKLLKLTAKIDIESRLTLGCAGAILTYLQRRRAVEYLPGDANADSLFQISNLATFSLKGVMLVNADTLNCLQILQSENHPQSHNQGPTKTASGSKEGLSIYGLFLHLARTPQGRHLLRQYFLRPSLDTSVINERLDTISCFLRPDNDGSLKSMVRSLGQIKDMKTVMIHLRKGVRNGIGKGGGIKSGIWSTLRSFAFHALQIRDAFCEVIGAERLAIRIKVFEKFEPRQLANIGRLVSQIVDFPESAEVHRTVVKSGIDEELDGMKQTYDGIEDLLNQTSLSITSTIPAQLGLDLNVIFFPQIGFLISIPVDPDTGRGDYEGDGTEEGRWDRIFSTSLRAYYKDYRMRELDETLGDMYAVICEKEIEIVHELGQEVLKYETMLNSTSEICGELDSLLALAQGARMHKFTRPQVTVENVIHIRGGRHPLQELTVSSYVANDTFLVGGPGSKSLAQMDKTSTRLVEDNSAITSMFDDEEAPSTLIMTGPNYSGKSVYLKQIALIVYMAHIGCFVPADAATIGLTDKILTRVATRETVSKSQSAFMIDLQQIALAMTLATNRSLVIIDEFGKGTESNDGAGLACGVFEHFLGMGQERPKILGATHFHEIFESGFLQSRPNLQHGHMDIRIDKAATDGEARITYLYSFQLGRSTLSFGSSCAADCGVESPILARADELVLLSARGEDLVAACASMSKNEEEDLENAEMMAKKFLVEDFRDVSIDEDHTGTIRSDEACEMIWRICSMEPRTLGEARASFT